MTNAELRMCSSKPIASSTNAGPGTSAAPSSDHSAPEMPPPQPVSGTPRGSFRIERARAASRERSFLTAFGSAPFCGPNSAAARSHGVLTSHTAVKLTPRGFPPSASSIPRPPSTVAVPPQATIT